MGLLSVFGRHASTRQYRLPYGRAAPALDRVEAWRPMRSASPPRCHRLESLTNGGARTIMVGGQCVRLRRVSPKRLKVAPWAGALIEALYYLGQDGVARVTDEHMARVARAMTDADRAALRNAPRLSSASMLPTIRRVLAAAAAVTSAVRDDV